MVHHCKAVNKGAKRPILVGDLPFGSYERDPRDAFNSAVRLIKEGGVQAVKLEGGKEQIQQVKALTSANIAVMGHIGLQPQSVNTIGAYRYVGQSPLEAKKLLEDALALQEAGCFAIVLECVPEEISAFITSQLTIPTIGIGAGRFTSGQVLVWHDLLGLFDSSPSFCKRYGDVGQVIQHHLNNYHRDVLTGNFPGIDNVRLLQNPANLNLLKLELTGKEEKKESDQDVTKKKPALASLEIPKRVLIIGSGAMGMFLAGKLRIAFRNQKIDSDVILYDPLYSNHLDMINHRGLAFYDLHESKPTFVEEIIVATNYNELKRIMHDGLVDVAFVLSKSYQIKDIFSTINLNEILVPDGIICSLQNGISHAELLSSYCSKDQKVVVGTTSHGAKILDTGTVSHTGHGNTYIVTEDVSDINALTIANLLNFANI